MSEMVVENLTKKFDSNKVLDRIDLKIRAMEYFVLLGSSGSGKTTLLRLIAGLEDMTSRAQMGIFAQKYLARGLTLGAVKG